MIEKVVIALIGLASLSLALAITAFLFALFGKEHWYPGAEDARIARLAKLSFWSVVVGAGFGLAAWVLS